MESGSGIVVEGFLCPMCLKDLKTPVLLAAHFEDVHASENDLLQQLRSVFGKAKKKIFKEEIVGEAESEVVERVLSRGVPATGGIDVDQWEPQEIGASRNWRIEFKNARKLRIESDVVEINKSLIRLEKLVKSGIFSKESALPAGAKLRKSTEKSVIHWENDRDVKFCPSCMKKFGVTFRRHHCRLCGKVTCGTCSDFLQATEAGQLLKLSPSSSLLGAAADDDVEEKNGLRMCLKCRDLLDKCQLIEQQKQAGTELVKLYSLLKDFIADADIMLPAFRKIANSVNSGETEFGLERALIKRKEVYAVLEKVDAVSKRILRLGTHNPEKPASPQALRLQRGIASLVSSYLQDHMIALPALPSHTAYDQLVKAKDNERRHREERLRMKRLAIHNRAVENRTRDHMSRSSEDVRHSLAQSDELSRSDSCKSKSRGKPGGGLFGMGKDNGTTSMGSSPDPMLQQMEIIKGYIKKARNARQHDNVELFERNLKELELEYARQMKQRK